MELADRPDTDNDMPIIGATLVKYDWESQCPSSAMIIWMLKIIF